MNFSVHSMDWASDNCAENDSALKQAAWALLLQEGLEDDFILRPLAGGKNNRVYRVQFAYGGDALLKSYFKHPSDPRDRCTTEFSFLTFAWEQGIRCVPKPLRCDAEKGLALYEFVDGEKLGPDDLTAESVREACDFWTLLNSRAALEAAGHLGKASEACFSIGSHMQCTERRVQNLLAASDNFSDNSAVSREAKTLIQQRLHPTWRRIGSSVERQCSSLNLSPWQEISLARRRLSPSDFGFHNALRRKTGELCFHDFEYAGWDDIAKTVCDFSLQPALPIPPELGEFFSSVVLEGFVDQNLENNRIKLLFPVHQLKWVCIMLNDFLPVGESRRSFALGSEQADILGRRRTQLELASIALEQF
jgi:Phosphotransferase enzyme family